MVRFGSMGTDRGYIYPLLAASGSLGCFWLPMAKHTHSVLSSQFSETGSAVCTATVVYTTIVSMYTWQHCHSPLSTAVHWAAEWNVKTYTQHLCT